MLPFSYHVKGDAADAAAMPPRYFAADAYFRCLMARCRHTMLFMMRQMLRYASYATL